MLIFPFQWRRPRDGMEIIESKKWGRCVQPVNNERWDSILYTASNLQDPISLHLVNAVSEDQLLAFTSYFGALDDFAQMSRIKATRDAIEQIYTLPLPTSPGRKIISDSMTLDKIESLNLHLKVRAEMDFYKGRFRLGLKPGTLAEFCCLEAATAVEVGATFTRCANCNKAFLYGPLTGRRSHSVYCSDRCRVAAMRARNVAKGGKVEDSDVR